MAKIIWFTGLSGVGKTTLCKKIKETLKGKKSLIIDGDIFRKKKKQFSFSKKNILKNNLEIIKYCKKNFYKYKYVFVAAISPLKKSRTIAHKLFKENYFEIFVYANIKTLINRDTKGLYDLAKKRKLNNLIGYNSKVIYEKSNHKFLKINTAKLTINESVKKILKYIIVEN